MRAALRLLAGFLIASTALTASLPDGAPAVAVPASAGSVVLPAAHAKGTVHVDGWYWYDPEFGSTSVDYCDQGQQVTLVYADSGIDLESDMTVREDTSGCAWWPSMDCDQDSDGRIACFLDLEGGFDDALAGHYYYHDWYWLNLTADGELEYHLHGSGYSNDEYGFEEEYWYAATGTLARTP